MKLKVVLDKGAFAPSKAHLEDFGHDLRTPVEITVKAQNSAVIDTGVHMEIPKGYVGFIKSKSGLNVKSGIQAEGVIDAGYTGSIVVKLYNHSDKDKHFDVGDKITQIGIFPILFGEEVEIVDSLEETERGNNGFGSTGK